MDEKENRAVKGFMHVNAPNTTMTMCTEASEAQRHCAACTVAQRLRVRVVHPCAHTTRRSRKVQRAYGLWYQGEAGRERTVDADNFGAVCCEHRSLRVRITQNFVDVCERQALKPRSRRFESADAQHMALT